MKLFNKFLLALNIISLLLMFCLTTYLFVEMALMWNTQLTPSFMQIWKPMRDFFVSVFIIVILTFIIDIIWYFKFKNKKK